MQVVEKEETEDNEATAGATAMTLTDAEQFRAANNGEQVAAAAGDDDKKRIKVMKLRLPMAKKGNEYQSVNVLLLKR